MHGGRTVEIHQRLAPLPGAQPERRVALTLDACSGASDTRIIDLLVARGIPATIFATANWIVGNAATVQRLRAHPQLFEVQNHGARHRPAVIAPGRSVYGIAALPDLAALHEEIDGGSRAIVAAGFAAPRWFRGATAVYDVVSTESIVQHGLRIAGFSVNADAGATLAQAEVERRLDRLQGGDIVLAHLNHPRAGTGAALAAALVRLQERGFQFVPLGDQAVQPLPPLPVATTPWRASRSSAALRAGTASRQTSPPLPATRTP